MSFTPPSTVAQISRVGATSSINASTGPILLLPVSPGDVRINGFGVNNTNKVLWVLFAATAIAPSKPAIAIAVGGNFDIEQGYQGVVQGFIAPGGAPVSGTIDMTEFNAG